jgi:hypothetical protein
MPYSVNPFTGEPEWRGDGGSAQPVLEVGGNTGTATPDGTGLITIRTAHATPKFVNSGNASVIDFDLTNLVLGTALPALNVGTGNVGMGQNVMGALTNGAGNVMIGHLTGQALTTGSNNVAIGKNSLINITGSVQNVAVGHSTLTQMTTSVGSNTAIGYASLIGITTGASNIGIGTNAGGNYTGAESSNIVIGSGGVTADSNAIRIGTSGSSTGQQNKAFIAGIVGTTVTGDFVNISSTGQLGTVSGATVGRTITGNSGGAISPVLGNWNLLTANSTAKFVGTAGTETLDFGIDNLNLGSSMPVLTSGSQNTGFGLGTLAALTSGTSNACFGIAAGLNITTAANNTYIGSGCGQFNVLGASNTGVGAGCLKSLINSTVQGGNNTAVGAMAGTNLVNGNLNILIGFSAGNSYTTVESNNIIIGNNGVVGEINTIRIGDLSGTQTACYIRGISGVTLAASAPVGIATNGQLSSFGFGTSGQVLTSGGAGVSPSWQTAASSINTITGNSGGARPATAGNFNIVTANSSIQFVGSGSTETLDFANTNLALGSSLPALAGGIANVSVGNTSMQSITTGVLNTVVGAQSATVLTTGNSNTIIGGAAGSTLTLGSNNTAVGANALNGYSTGTSQAGSNTALGVSALSTIGTGTFNIGIGASAGSSLNLANSSNICIGNTGTAGDNNTIRIGTQGTGTGQQSLTYIAGQLIGLSGRVMSVTTHASGTALTLSLTQYIVAVDSSGGARTVNLPAAPTTGQTYRIKDSVGSALTNNITISGNGKNIDGAASKVLNTNYASVDLAYTGTQWNIL